MHVLGCQSNTRTIAVRNPTTGKLINSRILCDDIVAVECDDIVSVFAVLAERSEEHTSELQSRETISYAVFCLKKKNS